MVFCAAITPVELAGCQVVPELSLAGSTSEPVQSHVHALGLSRYNGVVDDAAVGGVLDLNGCWFSWPTHFDEFFPEFDTFFGGDK